MKQHYTPQVYLRQWCSVLGRLVRYCRTGPPGAPMLRPDEKTPKEICWEHDLYSVPDGASANGMTGDEIEAQLSEAVESEVITEMVAAIGTRSGLLERALAERVQWLMQTFVARSRSGIEATTTKMTRWAAEHKPMVRRCLDKALPPEMQAELSQYLDPRMPTLAALAKLASVVCAPQSPIPGWYDHAAHVRVVQLAEVRADLAGVGLDHFPTFDEPVIEWETNELGVEASFAVSPGAIAFVVDEAVHVGDWLLTQSHVVSALRHRQFAICRNRAAAGAWLTEAERLRPWLPRCGRGVVASGR